MARTIHRLTTLEIRAIEPPKGAKGPRLVSDGGGLYFQATPQGSRSWLFRYTFNGKPKSIGLGPLRDVGLAEAREEAARLRKSLKLNVDPQSELFRNKPSSQSELMTFRVCSEQFIASIRAEHKNAKHHAQWISSLETYAYPILGSVPVSEITVQMIREVLSRNNLWIEKNETMSRVQGRIERILGWATVLGYRSGDNPARWKHFLSEVLPSRKAVRKVRHHAAVPHQDLPEFLCQLRQLDPSISRHALEFLILTAARTGEVIGATWGEINDSEKTWTVPANRMKAARQHVVPLSDQALEILKELRKLPHKEFIFPGGKRGKPLSNMAMLQLMRRMRTNGVPHGMRSSFRDWCADCTSYPREVAEASLAHVVGGTEGAYRRTDFLEKRRLLMADWGRYCSGER